MIFAIITKDLQKELKSNLPQIMILLKKQPAIAYKKIGDIGKEVGKKYDIELLVNFPHKGKIENFDMYGKQDLSFIVDMERTNFPIKRSIIKEKAREIFWRCGKQRMLTCMRVKKASKYFLVRQMKLVEKKRGLTFCHILCMCGMNFTDKVTEFCDWLLENVYLVKGVDHKGETKYEKFRIKQKEENV